MSSWLDARVTLPMTRQMINVGCSSVPGASETYISHVPDTYRAALILSALMTNHNTLACSAASIRILSTTPGIDTERVFMPRTR